MKKVFSIPASLKPAPFRYCPGCGHSLVHRLIAECIDHLKIRTKVIGIAPVGCAVFAYDYFNFDMLEAAHGRPPLLAETGILKKSSFDRLFSFPPAANGDRAAAINKNSILEGIHYLENKKSCHC